MAEESSKDHRRFSRSDLNYDFSSFHKVLSTDSEELDCLKTDCGEAFTCRSIPDANENYSSGSTYFVRADQDPRCFLEKLALSIFKFHTKGAAFDQELSGAEWWTQVIDCRDDVGFHWDRDYGNWICNHSNYDAHVLVESITGTQKTISFPEHLHMIRS